MPEKDLAQFISDIDIESMTTRELEKAAVEVELNETQIRMLDEALAPEKVSGQRENVHTLANLLEIGDLRMDADTRQVWVADWEIRLYSSLSPRFSPDSNMRDDGDSQRRDSW